MGAITTARFRRTVVQLRGSVRAGLRISSATTWRFLSSKQVLLEMISQLPCTREDYGARPEKRMLLQRCPEHRLSVCAPSGVSLRCKTNSG
ncbi:MAG: hypothetical protein DME97_13880 [Verrucomicrobia bacterium]|nr:MAG: hypothetical protein DME97_13880 [Verrucomicrobiota bacterium]